MLRSEIESNENSEVKPGWQRYLRWCLVLVPWLIAAWLVNKYALNQRIMDDWLLGDDLVQWKAGKLSIGDLFGVQMEHRLFVPRVLALGLGIALQGDVRALVALTMLFFTFEYLFVVWLWFRRTDLGKWAATAGCVISGLLLLSPLKFQTYHFPICFITITPLACLAGVLRISLSQWPVWLRLFLCCCCAWVGMLSFAPGMLSWGLAIPVFLWVAPMASPRQRKQFLAAWLGICVISFALYFRNFHNAVYAAYAYGQGAKNVLESDTAYFFSHLPAAVGFIFRWLGSFLAHGLHCSQPDAAMLFGLVQVGLYLFLVVYTIRNWKDVALRQKMVLWLSYATYTLCTGGMVTVGRLWMEPHEQTSLNLRYHVHQSALTIGLIAGLWLVARHWLAQRPRAVAVGLTNLGWACMGGLLILQTLQWIYGATLMKLWRDRHITVGLTQRFYNVSQDNFYLNKLAGDFEYGKQVALGLEKLGYLDKFFPSDRLDQFKIQQHAGAPGFAGFDRLWKGSDGKWQTRGFSLLGRDPDIGKKTKEEVDEGEYNKADTVHFPSDLILFTFRLTPQEPWRIFGFTALDNVPSPMREWYRKDLEGIGYHIWPWPRRMNGEWGTEVGILQEPPADAEVSAWSLEHEGLKVQRVPFGPAFADGRSVEELRNVEALPLKDLMRGFIGDPTAPKLSPTAPTPVPAHE